jgi:hypothetical protein
VWQGVLAGYVVKSVACCVVRRGGRSCGKEGWQAVWSGRVLAFVVKRDYRLCGKEGRQAVW